MSNSGGLMKMRRAWMPVLGMFAATLCTAHGGVAATTSGSDVAACTLLSQRPDTGVRGGVLESASPDYVEHGVEQYDERADPALAIVRVSDGATVRTVPLSKGGSSNQPRLVNDAVVDVAVGSGSGPGLWTVTAVETGAVLSQVHLDGYTDVVRAGDRWALVAGKADERDATSQRVPMDIVRADGTVVRVAGPVGENGRGEVGWVGGDEETAFVNDAFGSYAIDTATGAVTELADTFFGGETPLKAVTAHRLYFWKKASDGGEHYAVSWRQRAGSTTGSFGIPTDYHDRGLYPLGDGLAELLLTDTGGSTDLELHAVDDDGAVGATIADGFEGITPMSDGRIAALRSGDTVRHVVVVSPGTPPSVRTLTAVPLLDVPVDAVTLDGSSVYASWQGQTELLRSTITPGADWQHLSPAANHQDVSYFHASETFDEAGGTVVTRVDDEPASSMDYLVSWPGGSRHVPVGYGYMILAHGGRYLVRRLPGSGAPLQLEDARTGAVIETWSDQRNIVIDGDWKWSLQRTDSGGDSTAVTDALVGHSLSDATKASTVPLPMPCGANRAWLDDVRGRWAKVECGGTTYVVDLDGVVEPWPVPSQQGQLGGDFYAWTTSTPVPGKSYSQILLHVADLTAAHAQRAYGNLRGNNTPPGIDFAVNDDGSHSLVYADSASLPRYVDLGWVQTPPTTTDPVPPTPPVSPPDTTAPTLRAAQGSPSTLPSLGGTVTYRYGATDRSLISWYDVRSRVAGPGRALGRWKPYKMLTMATKVSRRVSSGTTACFSFRARDRAGNISRWSAARCSTAPLDDGSLRATGTRATVKLAGALGGGYTRVQGTHDGLHVTLGLHGEVRVWEVRAPHAGTAVALLGGHRLGTLTFAATRTRRVVEILSNPHHYTGTLVLKPTSSRPVRVDAVAMLP
ncbi:MAG: hypothetical protein ACTHJH_05955 [Marmoricola sp.]